MRSFAITLTITPPCFLPLHKYAAVCAACGFRLRTDFDGAVRYAVCACLLWRAHASLHFCFLHSLLLVLVVCLVGHVCVFVFMMSTNDALCRDDIFEARGYDELVVEELFHAATDDEDYDVAEYSTGDDSRRWLEKFRKRRNIAVRKVQRRTKLSDAERDARSQKFYVFWYLQPSTVRVWLTLDEIPASLGGLLGNVETLEHMGSMNVMAL